MKKTIAKIVTLSVLVLIPFSGSVFANSDIQCTTEPGSSWKPLEQAEASTRVTGNKMHKPKGTNTGCHEVYGVYCCRHRNVERIVEKFELQAGV